MAFIRRRLSKGGTVSVSTALVEAYRDENGRPRQRLLANLHGEPDTLNALAKLAAQREALRKERETLAADVVQANQFYEAITQNTLLGHQYAAPERKEIDDLMAARRRLLKRVTQVETALTVIQRDGAIIKKHCSATPEEIQTAIQSYRERLRDAEAMVLGLEFAGMQLKEAKTKLRRMSI